MLELFKENPFLEIPDMKHSSKELKTAMSEFLNRPLSYRMKFAQKHFEEGFDGYSYPGQLDSINQGYDDHLHSMVLSSSHELERFPMEFHEFLKKSFSGLIDEISEGLALPVIEQKLGLENQLTFSLSVNYYPSFIDSEQPAGPRLTEHVDGSLITVFPFGFDEGLNIFIDNEWKELAPNTSTVAFPGYMMGLASNNEITPLKHRLSWPKDISTERFAFAFFIVPKPNEILGLPNGKELTTQEYYKRYLALFD
ncbi:MAG: 2OG-Fe(II) oxygenase family protein [Salibacteraceae bacterium]